MIVSRVSRGGAGTMASVALTLLCARSARAEQFITADVTYTHSAQTTSDSHYRIDPTVQTPGNWTAPINYAGGSAHVRLEVRSKPNLTTQTCFQVCFEASTNYGCTDISKPYTGLGVYEWDTPFSRFFTPGPVSWNTGVRKVALLLKDTMNGKPAPENVGAATSALYMPTDVHVTVTIVSAGSTYQGPPSDGGVPEAARADANLPDAARGARDASASDASGSNDPAAPEAATTTPERPPSAEAAAPAPTTTSPPSSGQGGGGSTPVPTTTPTTTPSAAPSTGPMTPGQPDEGGGCSLVRFPKSHSSRFEMLASAVMLAIAASRRRRVIAARSKREACL